MIELRIDAWPSDAELGALLATAWPNARGRAFRPILERSLVHICAYDGAKLVGFVNVATDGEVHASIFDTCVHPEFQRRGLGGRLVAAAAFQARERGAEWLHVDYEARLAPFYKACGFRPAAAGLMALRGQSMAGLAPPETRRGRRPITARRGRSRRAR